jgi:hypothetical protein
MLLNLYEILATQPYASTFLGFECLLFASNLLAFFLFLLIFHFTKSSDDKTFIKDYFLIERSIWSKIKFYLLFFTMIGPNYVYIFLVPWWAWSFSFLVCYFMAKNFVFLYVIVGLKAYYVVSSFIFGLLYEKSGRFKFYINKLFFLSDKLNAYRFLTYFYGNMFSKAVKSATSSAVLAKVLEYQYSSEISQSKVEAKEEILWATSVAKKYSFDTPQEAIAYKSSLQSEILAKQPLHKFESLATEQLLVAKDIGITFIKSW